MRGHFQTTSIDDRDTGIVSYPQVLAVMLQRKLARFRARLKVYNRFPPY
jgi:hypothetical protein